jgi:hypothetical protein
VFPILAAVDQLKTQLDAIAVHEAPPPPPPPPPPA